MQTCGESGSSAGWSITANSNVGALASGFECPPHSRPPGFPTGFQQAGIWLSDRLTNVGGELEAQAGDRAETSFAVAPGTTIRRMRYWRAIHKESEDNYKVYISLNDREAVVDTCEIGGQSVCTAGADDWYSNDASTTDRGSYRDLGNLSAQSIIVGIYCRDNVNHLCGNGDSLTNVDAEIFSAFLTISDPIAPALGTPTGEGWSGAGWQEGTLPLAVASMDNTGIAATKVYADGSLIGSLQRVCSYDRPRPCTDEGSGAVGLPTGGLADGVHAISVGAVDAAGNETKMARPVALKVDNDAPEAPVADVDDVVSSENRFDVTWALPSDAGSPIVAARHQLCQAGVCGAVQTAPSVDGVDGVVLPEAGEATLRVWLVDELGHEAMTNAAAIKLTYAPVPPQAPQPAPPGGPVPGALVPPTDQGRTPEQAVPGPGRLPMPSVKKGGAGLKITTVRYARGRLAVKGTVSARASGVVTVRFRVRVAGRTRTVETRTRIRARKFGASVALTTAMERVRAGTVTVKYAGDADTVAASRQSVVRWRG
jgi:hypothetical protein